MSPRPRETSDAEILAAAARVMERRSPVELTLADVAEEAGVHPATIIQRFGTKRGLLLANCKAWTGGVARQFVAARAKHESPLKTLIELLVECNGFAATPESLAIALAYLQIDLTDPEFHAVLLTQFTVTHDEVRKLLDEAVRAGELKAYDTAGLARLMQEVSNGAMLDWAVYRKGTLGGWIRRSLETLLAAYRPEAPHKSRSPVPRT